MKTIYSIIAAILLAFSFAPVCYAADAAPQPTISQVIAQEVSKEVTKQVADAIAAKNAPAQTAATPAATTQADAKQVTPPATPEVNYKDAFLSLVLRKAEKYSDKAEVAIGKAVDIASEEAPILLKEYIGWKLAASISYIALPFIFATVFWILLGVCKGKAQWTRDESPANASAFFVCVGWIGGIVSSIAFIITTIVNTATILQLIIAPRVYIIQQAIDLIKANK